MSQVIHYPKKLFFYGDVVPESGGETPVSIWDLKCITLIYLIEMKILLSNELYKRMLAKHPAFVEKLEKFVSSTNKRCS